MIANQIKGIDELRANKRAIEEWHDEFTRRMETEDEVIGMPPSPKDRSAELAKKYPRAAAYLKAEALTFRSNYELSLIGDRACKRILAGEDYIKVISDMDAEREAFVRRHIWD